jgi:hypothetical protein
MWLEMAISFAQLSAVLQVRQFSEQAIVWLQNLTFFSSLKGRTRSLG